MPPQSPYQPQRGPRALERPSPAARPNTPTLDYGGANSAAVRLGLKLPPPQLLRPDLSYHYVNECEGTNGAAVPQTLAGVWTSGADTGGSTTYDTGWSPGSFNVASSIRFNGSAGTGNIARNWDGIPSVAGALKLSVYVKMDVVAGWSTTNIFILTQNAPNLIAGAVRVSSTGKFGVADAATSRGTSTLNLVANEEYRLDWYTDLEARTQRLEIFVGANIHGTTPDEVMGPFSFGTINETPVIDRLRLGLTANNGVVGSLWMDSLWLTTGEMPAARGGGATNYPRTASDSAPADDAVVRTLGAQARAIAESSPAADSLARALGAQARAIAETAGASDALTRTSSRPRALAESAPASDALARAAQALARTAAETAGASDTLTRTSSRPRAIAESAPASDALAALPVKVRAVSESAPASDTLARAAQALSRALSEAAGASDALGRTLGTQARTTADSAPASDALTRTSSRPRALAESAPAADSLARSSSRPRGLAESAPAADSLARALGAQARAIAESAPASDGLTHNLVPAGGGSVSRTASDSAPASDAVVRTLGAQARAASETAGASDSLARSSSRPRALAESAPAADSLARSSSRPRAIAESAPASDSLARSQGAKARAVSESGPASDGLSHVLTPAGGGSVSRTASDSAPAADTLARSLASSRPIAEELESRNRMPDFDSGLWTLTGGATISAGELTLPPGSTARVKSFVGGVYGWSFSAEWWGDTQSPYVPFQPNSARLLSSLYYALDGITPATNPAGYVGNGNAVAFPAGSVWNARTIAPWSYIAGPAVQWVEIVIENNATWTAGTIKARAPMLAVQATGSYVTPYQRLDAGSTMDAVTRSSSRPRALAESAPSSDALARQLANPRGIAESTPAADALARSQAAKARAASDSAPAADSLSRSTLRPRTLTELAAAADALSRALLQLRGIGESAPAADAVSRVTNIPDRLRIEVRAGASSPSSSSSAVSSSVRGAGSAVTGDLVSSAKAGQTRGGSDGPDYG